MAARAAVVLLGAYRALVSPLYPPACRFYPSCSRYATEAIATFGFWKGSFLSASRLLRCHPFHPGGYDPVPDLPHGGISKGKADLWK